MDLDEMMGFLITTGQVDENFGLKKSEDEEEKEPEDD